MGWDALGWEGWELRDVNDPFVCAWCLVEYPDFDTTVHHADHHCAARPGMDEDLIPPHAAVPCLCPDEQVYG